MKATVGQITWFIWTVTLCLAFLLWGTIFVVRQVTDVNYHEPTAQDKYRSCINGTMGPTKDLDKTCRQLAGLK